MNTAKLNTYAPKARRDFIAAITDRAALLGITPKKILPVETGTDVVVIAGTPWPKSVGTQREKLVEQIEAEGFDRVIEAAAYSWFNRLVALRYMELHGYLDHGYRVLSHPDDPAGDKRLNPEILSHAEHLDTDQLPGLSHDEVVSLKLDSKDEPLFRLVLIAQCNALHKAMPFLFEKLGDATELLLPDHLLRPDSILRQLVTEIPEADWQQVEIIGWLYQFYISEKKEQVIGKTVKSEDIPAATQLFTPNWIVKYMVQNALGAQWLATYPDSPLKSQMDYYIEPAEQTPDVQAQLESITPKSLDPEKLTLIDPACGSGHILVEAYDLFKAIYLERGYRLRDIPEKILRHNLFGLEIDPRATQLAGFALMMKARHDDPRIFTRGDASTGGAPWMNVRCIVSSDGIDADAVYEALAGEEADEESGEEFGFMEEIRAPLLAEAKREKHAASGGVEASGGGFSVSDLKVLLSLFSGEQAQTFGSLIQIPDGLAKKLPMLVERADRVRHAGDLNRSDLADRFFAIAEQAQMLASRYDAVVANPPYMGHKFYCQLLKQYISEFFEDGKADLYGVFTLRNTQLVEAGGRIGMITIPNWMFLSSFESFRNTVLSDTPISSLVHNGRGVWGSDFGSCSYVLQKCSPQSLRGTFLRLFTKKVSVATNAELMRRFHEMPRYTTINTDFEKIPSKPIAYWVSDAVRVAYRQDKLGDQYEVREGLGTRDDDRFMRRFWEVSQDLIQESSDTPGKWIRTDKAGGFRKWYGQLSFVMEWESDGYAIRNFRNPDGSLKSRPQNTQFFFLPAVSWGKVGSGASSFRYRPEEYGFNDAAPSIFGKKLYEICGLMNSAVLAYLLEIQGETMNVTVGIAKSLPLIPSLFNERLANTSKSLIDMAKADWDSAETSHGFSNNPLISVKSDNLPKSCEAWTSKCVYQTIQMKMMEEENNQLIVDAYGLQDELSPEVPIEQITLTVNPAYRYGIKLSEAEREDRFRQDTMRELVSYAVGCMMGRYSLDAPGIIYAHAGGEGFDPSRYTTFAADEDGIIPLTDTEWFEDDATARLIEFIGKAWPSKGLEANLNFLAENLGPKKNESSRETLRRYLSDGFYKDHLQTYKKRPIYWLFTSGKHKAFQALVYLHRYNPGTLSRMRTKYVLPLMGKLDALIQRLDGSTNLSTNDRKELDLRKKQLAEIKDFDEKLHHLADQRIALDLDDGVKVNYGKFSTPQGEILAEVKAIVGRRGN